MQTLLINMIFLCLLIILLQLRFSADLLKAALQNALEKDLPITDDCSAVEELGKMVYLVEGDEENLKITTPTDLVLARALLRAREECV